MLCTLLEKLAAENEGVEREKQTEERDRERDALILLGIRVLFFGNTTLHPQELTGGNEVFFFPGAAY